MKTLLWLVSFGIFATEVAVGLNAQETVVADELDPSDLIHDRSVAKDLELMDSQVENLRSQLARNGRELRKSGNDALAEAIIMFSEFGRDSEFARGYLSDVLVEMEEERQSMVRNVLTDVLLPHQLERLAQLRIWRAINGKGGIVDFLFRQNVSNALETDARLQDELKQKAGTLQAEFEKELAALRKEFREKLSEKLKPEQRKKMEKLLGDESRLGTPKIRF